MRSTCLKRNQLRHDRNQGRNRKYFAIMPHIVFQGMLQHFHATSNRNTKHLHATNEDRAELSGYLCVDNLFFWFTRLYNADREDLHRNGTYVYARTHVRCQSTTTYFSTVWALSANVKITTQYDVQVPPCQGNRCLNFNGGRFRNVFSTFGWFQCARVLALKINWFYYF